MTTEILDKIILRQGGGAGDPKQGLCVMELVSWLAGADETNDHPDTASPLLTRFAIALNDTAPSTRTRNSLRALAPLLVGTYCASAESARADHIVRQVAAKIVAPSLAREGYARHARTLAEAQARDEIAVAARDIRQQLGDGRTADLVVALESAASHPLGADLAEQILLRLECSCCDDSAARRRLALWRAMRDILESAARLGPHGGADSAAIDRRLDMLAERLWPRMHAADAAPALPNWLDALVHGPAGSPQLPAPPKQAVKALEDA